jgi:hypothetical protein
MAIPVAVAYGFDRRETPAVSSTNIRSVSIVVSPQRDEIKCHGMAAPIGEPIDIVYCFLQIVSMPVARIARYFPPILEVTSDLHVATKQPAHILD